MPACSLALFSVDLVSLPCFCCMWFLQGVLAKIALELCERSVSNTLQALRRVAQIWYAAAANPTAGGNGSLEHLQETALQQAEAAMSRTIKRLTIARALAISALVKEANNTSQQPTCAASEQQLGLLATTHARVVLQQCYMQLRLLRQQHHPHSLQAGWMAATAGTVLPAVLPALAADVDDEGEEEVSSRLNAATFC